ncbi:MAG: carboxypeptidase-like regulatory domain-containing protein [Bacteroidota bacterium]
MKNSLVTVCLFLSFGLSAQIISGKVTNEQSEPLVGANIYWSGTNIGVSTDERGVFQISSEKIIDKKLIASFTGYLPDTIATEHLAFIEFRLTEIEALKEVVVKGKREGIIMSNINTIKTEQITQTELKKAACCDLAGCFGTQRIASRRSYQFRN